MKILLLGDINSPHIQKWSLGLAGKGIEIGIFSLSAVETHWYEKLKNIKILSDGWVKDEVTFRSSGFTKLTYLKALPALKKILKDYQPDILHAHYATSYGFLGAQCSFHPFIISVWGSDVFDFPNEGFVQKKLLKYNLKKADKILSTSHVMAKETKKYTDKEIEVIPFGVDLDVFKPQKAESLFNKNDIVIGTVKTLEEKYGIEYLIQAFKILIDKHDDLPLKLLIVGDGTREKYLKALVKKLAIEEHTIFTGRVNWNETPKYHNMLSVSVSVSESESFGVAVIEASACEKPVVVSNVGGLPEVVEDDVTGFVVSPENPEKTAEAIEKLILNNNLRIEMGKNGRKRVEELYHWKKNLEQMTSIYQSILRKK